LVRRGTQLSCDVVLGITVSSAKSDKKWMYEEPIELSGGMRVRAWSARHVTSPSAFSGDADGKAVVKYVFVVMRDCA
jgi:hypothetical protein